LTALVAPALAGCARGPSGPSLVSASKERELGQEAASEVERTVGLVQDPALVGYVNEIGRRLAAQVPSPSAPYEFHVADDTEPNAFALPGGFVYVTRGILALANSEDELAGVLGHEIGHVVARHSVRQLEASTPFALLFGVPSAIVGVVSPALGGILGGVGKLASGLVLAPYSREQERAADRIGIELAAKAGWDPAGLPTLLHTLEREEALAGSSSRISFFANHPATPERVRDTTAAARTLSRGAGHPIAATRPTFLARLDGLVVGPDPASGIFVGSTFQHPDLGLALEMPAGWRTKNTPAAAIAVQPNGRAAVALHLVAEGDDPVKGAREDGLDEDAVRQLTRRTISGLPAVQLIARDGTARFHLTWIAHQLRVFRVAGIAAVRDFESYREAFERAASSFRALRRDERERIVEARLRSRPLRSGESLAAFVTRTGGVWKVEETAVANGITADARLDEGFAVKVPIRQRYAGRQPSSRATPGRQPPSLPQGERPSAGAVSAGIR
jgi:predicted Zn-dependent protease